MSQFLVGRMAVKARRIKPGEAFAVEVKKDELLQIVTVDGRQVVQFVAFDAADPTDRLSTAVTRAKNTTIMLQKDKVLYSARGTRLFKLTEDTVGRHDLFYPVSDTQPANPTEGLDPLPSGRTALTEAFQGHEIPGELIPDPVNFFMRVSILQKGEIEVQETLSEKNDYVVLEALTDALVGVSLGSVNENGGTAAKNSDVLIRVFR